MPLLTRLQKYSRRRLRLDVGKHKGSIRENKEKTGTDVQNALYVLSHLVVPTPLFFPITHPREFGVPPNATCGSFHDMLTRTKPLRSSDS